MKIYGESEHNTGLPTPRLTLDDGGTHPGAWVSFRDPAVVDTLAAEGFDWICIDGQHGGPETHEMQPLIEAAHLFSVPSIVRVPGHDMGIIGRILDAGAGGIIFPTVETAVSAASLIAACRFPPRGNRSYGPTRRSPRYPKPVPGNPQDDTLCILMIETAGGLANSTRFSPPGRTEFSWDLTTCPSAWDDTGGTDRRRAGRDPRGHRPPLYGSRCHPRHLHRRAGAFRKDGCPRIPLHADCLGHRAAGCCGAQRGFRIAAGDCSKVMN